MSVLEVKHLDVFHGDLQVIFDLSIQIEKGGITTLVGANGSGKTTLMNSILALNKQKKGEILHNGENIEHLKTTEIVERGIVLVPEGRGLFPFLTVKENLLLGASTKRARKIADENLEKVFQLFPRLHERLKQQAGSLSGGEQQMCSIGRALMADPEIILLDEPSLGLAPIMVELVFNTIKELAANDFTIMLVEQNVTTSLEIAKQAFVLQEGRVVMEGVGKDLLNDEGLRKAYLGM